MDFKLINVGIADMGVSVSPNILRTILGSCVGICLYDADARIGGMSHIMLPKQKPGARSMKKYADTAIPLLLEEMEKKGARKGRVIAKIVGGSRMFNVSNSSVMGEIGNNNVIKVREILGILGIEIVAEDLGGNFGRTIDFYLETGEVKIKSIGRQEKRI